MQIATMCDVKRMLRLCEDVHNIVATILHVKRMLRLCEDVLNIFATM
jgi:hypothetical protein